MLKTAFCAFTGFQFLLIVLSTQFYASEGVSRPLAFLILEVEGLTWNAGHSLRQTTRYCFDPLFFGLTGAFFYIFLIVEAAAFLALEGVFGENAALGVRVQFLTLAALNLNALLYFPDKAWFTLAYLFTVYLHVVEGSEALADA